MCRECWEYAGAEPVDNEAVRLAASLIDEVYGFCPVGGNLHIAVDDWNLEDSDLAFCERCIREDGEGDDHPRGQLDAEWAALRALKALTYEERASALALRDGFWTTTA